VNTARRDRWLVAAGVVVMLVALVVVGRRLQGGNLPESDAGAPRTTSTTVADAPPVASGLAVAGRVALPAPAAAVAVGEGAIWVLRGQGTLLRVDPDRHQVTGRLELGAPTGPLAVGAGAVWVGNGQATVTARVDPVRLRVTARFRGYVVAVAHGVLWSYCCRRGYKPMGFSRIDARTLRPRPPLVVTDASGRRQPVGRLAVGTDAVWTQTPEDQRLWRVPLGGGPARAVRVPGTGYGLAADAGAVWVLSGTDPPGSERDRTGRLRRLDQRTGKVTATTPLPDLAPSRAVGPVVGGGAVWLGGPYSGGLHDSGILLRVESGSGRVAGWLRGPRWFVRDVLAAGPRELWVATAGPELLQVVAT
jgi:outer membrane protein assembly factor BamB